MTNPSDPADLGDSFDLELAAAQLRSDGTDVRILLNVLVEQLSGALGSQLRIQRAGGLIRKSDEIRSLKIVLGKEEFDAEMDRSSLRCTVGHSSGGIRIRSESVEMEVWLRRLLAALKIEAEHSQAVRLALENIVIGGNG